MKGYENSASLGLHSAPKLLETRWKRGKIKKKLFVDARPSPLSLWNSFMIVNRALLELVAMFRLWPVQAKVLIYFAYLFSCCSRISWWGERLRSGRNFFPVRERLERCLSDFSKSPSNASPVSHGQGGKLRPDRRLVHICWRCAACGFSPSLEPRALVHLLRGAGQLGGAAGAAGAQVRAARLHAHVPRGDDQVARARRLPRGRLQRRFRLRVADGDWWASQRQSINSVAEQSGVLDQNP